MEIDGGEACCVSPEIRPLFKVGDCVQVFDGTGTGQVKMRSVGWFGRVEGMKEGKYMVRNRILARRGTAALIEGQYLKLQTDFGLGVGSGERTHFRSLSKRSRARIEDSNDGQFSKLDAIFITNSQRADARREKNRLDDDEAATRKMAKKGIKFNNALEEPLAATVGDLDLEAHLQSMGNAVGVSKEYLKRQYHARLLRAEEDEFTYPSIGDKYRTQTKKRKLKMTPRNSQNDMEYLKELVILMMKADSRRGAVTNETIALSGLLRKVPTLNVLVQSTNATALRLRQNMEDAVCVQATQADDPWLLFLTAEYVGRICFLHDVTERHKLYRVCNIAYWTSNKTRYANWEETLEPVHLMSTGLFEVADEDTILGPSGVRLTKSKVLLGYILVAQYIDGDDEDPTRSDCVDLYIENALEKLKAYLFKLQQNKQLQK
jgi:hypothetical protein